MKAPDYNFECLQRSPALGINKPRIQKGNEHWSPKSSYFDLEDKRWLCTRALAQRLLDAMLLDRMAQDGLEFAGVGTARVAQIDLVMFAVGFVAVLVTEGDHTSDGVGLVNVGAEMHDLHA